MDRLGRNSYHQREGNRPHPSRHPGQSESGDPHLYIDGVARFDLSLPKKRVIPNPLVAALGKNQTFAITIYIRFRFTELTVYLFVVLYEETMHTFRLLSSRKK